MQEVCRKCCKIFCTKRDTVTECNEQITFVTQMLQEIDKKLKYDNVDNNFQIGEFEKQTRMEVKKT